MLRIFGVVGRPRRVSSFAELAVRELFLGSGGEPFACRGENASIGNGLDLGAALVHKQAYSSVMKRDRSALIVLLERARRFLRWVIFRAVSNRARTTTMKKGVSSQYAREGADWQNVAALLPTLPRSQPRSASAWPQALDEQKEFVRWWREVVTVRQSPGGADRASNADLRSMVSLVQAEDLTGITQQQVSKWAKRLQDREAYSQALYGAAYRKAMAERGQTDQRVASGTGGMGGAHPSPRGSRASKASLRRAALSLLPRRSLSTATSSPWLKATCRSERAPLKC